MFGYRNHQDHSGTSWLERLLPALVLVLAGLLIPAAASATTFSVVNQQGVPQAGADVELPPAPGCTPEVGNGGLKNCDPWFPSGEGTSHSGQTEPWLGLEAGDELVIDREPPNVDPTLQFGVRYTVPSPVPSTVTVTLPTLATPTEPGLSSRERGLIGLINNERQSLGIAPLYISNTLDTSADGYLIHVPPYDQLPEPKSLVHTLYSTPYGRVMDTGFPLPSSVGENIDWSPSATDTYNAWMSDAGHRENMMNPAFNAVGVGNIGETWVLDLAYVAAPYPASAQMTGDTGDASLADGPYLPTPSGPTTTSTGVSKTKNEKDGGGDAQPILRLSTRVQRHLLKVSVATAPGLNGQVKLSVRHGHQDHQLHLNTAGRARAHLTTGHWTVTASFIPRSNGATSNVTRHVFIAHKTR